MEGLAKLYVKICNAEKLLDYKSTNAYCLVSVENESPLSTKVRPKDQNPVWDTSTVLSVLRSKQTLQITVFNKNEHASDAFIGTVVVPVTMFSNTIKTFTLALQHKGGSKIKILHEKEIQSTPEQHRQTFQLARSARALKRSHPRHHCSAEDIFQAKPIGQEQTPAQITSWGAATTHCKDVEKSPLIGKRRLLSPRPDSANHEVQTSHIRGTIGILKNKVRHVPRSRDADVDRGSITIQVRMVKLEPLAKILTQPPFTVTLSLCKFQINARLAQALVSLFKVKRASLGLVKHLIDAEVDYINEEATLFRVNSMATKVAVKFFWEYGHMAVHRTLGPLLQGVCDHPSEVEVCPMKLPNHAQIEQQLRINARNLRNIATKFLNVIFDVGRQLPWEIRAVCHHLAEVVAPKFPESQYKSVGAFVFLRFICPAVLTPSKYNLIVGEPSPKAQRQLILIAKILQNMANGVEFAKEKYMLPFNSLIDEKQKEVDAFFVELATVGYEYDGRSHGRSHQIMPDLYLKKLLDHFDVVVEALLKERNNLVLSPCNRILDGITWIKSKEV